MLNILFFIIFGKGQLTGGTSPKNNCLEILCFDPLYIIFLLGRKKNLGASLIEGPQSELVDFDRILTITLKKNTDLYWALYIK